MRQMIFDLHHEGCDASEIHSKLKEEFGRRAYSLSTVYSWIAKAKTGQEDVADAHRPGRPIDDQLLVEVEDTLDKEPYATIGYIADTVGSNKATVYRYVTEHLKRVYKHSRWVPHLLTTEQKKKRVEQCKALADILRKCSNEDWRNIITGDQSWFSYGYGVDGAWLAPDEEAPIMDGSKIQIKKIMITVIWGVHGIYLVDILPEGASFNSEYFIEHIITPLENMRNEIWSESDRRKIWLHLDNCRVHNSKQSSEKIEASGFKRTPHPPYSPDVAPSDFFLFGYTKLNLKGFKCDDVDDLVEKIYEILHKISKQKRKEVFEAWIKRCDYVSTHGGNYYDRD